MKLAILVGFILCLLVFSSSVFAQSASVSGDIRGTITDPSGAVLPKATITATAPQTGRHRTAVSDANGQFRLAGLPPAMYDLTAELPGFSTQSRKGVALRFHRPSAYHEAGHAVVAVALGIAVDSVSISPDRSRGTLDWYSSARTNLRQGENPYGDEGVIILLAGAAAQKKHAPSSMRRYTAIGDYDKVQTLVFHGVKAEHEGYAVFKKRWDWLVAETTKITEANWHVVDAVARRLLIVGEITGNEVKTIFRQSKGIRQRLSKDPRRYERFHAASDARKSYL